MQCSWTKETLPPLAGGSNGRVNAGLLWSPGVDMERIQMGPAFGAQGARYLRTARIGHRSIARSMHNPASMVMCYCLQVPCDLSLYDYMASEVWQVFGIAKCFFRTVWQQTNLTLAVIVTT